MHFFDLQKLMTTIGLSNTLKNLAKVFVIGWAMKIT